MGSLNHSYGIVFVRRIISRYPLGKFRSEGQIELSHGDFTRGFLISRSVTDSSLPRYSPASSHKNQRGLPEGNSHRGVFGFHALHVCRFKGAGMELHLPRV